MNKKETEVSWIGVRVVRRDEHVSEGIQISEGEAGTETSEAQ